MLQERKACLTKGSYADGHTRWRGLESHLLNPFQKTMHKPYRYTPNCFTTLPGGGLKGTDVK